MPRQKLNETLSTLHDQLRPGTPLDEGDKAHLKDVLHDIERALDAEEPHEGIGERVNEAVAEFETSHPTVALALHEIVDLLKRL